MDKFLVIDGNSIMNRAFYAIRGMNVDGMYTNALYGFLNIYWMIENMIQPDMVVVTFDISKKTFRNDLYDKYKGNRKGMPDELRPQMKAIKEILNALNITIIEKERF